MALAADRALLTEALAGRSAHCITLDGAEAVIIGGGPLGQAAEALRPRFHNAGAWANPLGGGADHRSHWRGCQRASGDVRTSLPAATSAIGGDPLPSSSSGGAGRQAVAWGRGSHAVTCRQYESGAEPTSPSASPKPLCQHLSAVFVFLLSTPLCPSRIIEPSPSREPGAHRVSGRETVRIGSADGGAAGGMNYVQALTEASSRA